MPPRSRNKQAPLPACTVCEGRKTDIFSPENSHGRILVTFNPSIFSIVELNDSMETLTLDLGLSFEWHDPFLAKDCNGVSYASHPQIRRLHGQTAEMFPEKKELGTYYFSPAWKVKGATSTQIIRDIHAVLDPISGHVHQFIQINVTYPHKLFLQKFPYDQQTIVAELLSEHDSKNMQFVRDNFRKPAIYTLFNSEWEVVVPSGEPTASTMQVRFSDERKVLVSTGSGRDYARCSFQFQLRRKAGWYEYNVMFVSFIIVLASMSAFVVSWESIGERLGIVFTTWLLLVSLKFVISDRLPKINYFTFLDIYMLFSYIVMMLMVVYTVMIYSKNSKLKGQGFVPIFAVMHNFIDGFTSWDMVEEEETIVAFGTVWIAFHVCIYLGTRYGIV